MRSTRSHLQRTHTYKTFSHAHRSSHIKIWNLANHMKKNETKNIRPLVFSLSPIDLAILMYFVLFFHVVCKISNFNMWTVEHLVKISCTELTLLSLILLPTKKIIWISLWIWSIVSSKFLIVPAPFLLLYNVHILCCNNFYVL